MRLGISSLPEWLGKVDRENVGYPSCDEPVDVAPHK